MTAADISNRMMFSSTVCLAFQPGTRFDVAVTGSEQNKSEDDKDRIGHELPPWYCRSLA
ncbi:hypothetical protein [Bryocella elongata]|uniref:hypothetical protein n=1 Tax=Bryocella elongata TaxID=863522 RepID=UPI001F164274|nr:hypothetical protein [Bryocella elongata]